jgi:hypothetical protein
MILLLARRRAAHAVVGLAALAAASIASADTPECNPRNGCVGYRNGMRVFSSNPTVHGVIKADEAFIDLGTRYHGGKYCENGVVRVGQNTNRASNPAATRDTTARAGTEGGRPIQGCAP